MRYEFISSKTKYKSLNGYKAYAKSPYTFLAHCSIKSNHKFSYEQLVRALKRGYVYVELTLL
jgi:hypothetical protein